MGQSRSSEERFMRATVADIPLLPTVECERGYRRSITSLTVPPSHEMTRPRATAVAGVVFACLTITVLVLVCVAVPLNPAELRPVGRGSRTPACCPNMRSVWVPMAGIAARDVRPPGTEAYHLARRASNVFLNIMAMRTAFVPRWPAFSGLVCGLVLIVVMLWADLGRHRSIQ